MTIFRTEKNSNYSTIANYILRDVNVSLKSKGLMAMILSLPANWELSINGLAAITKEGRTAIETGLKELIRTGYCKRKQIKIDNKFAGYEYIFYENKNNINYSEKPFTENQDTEKQFTENQEQSSTDLPSTDLPSTELKNNIYSSFSKFWELYPRKTNRKKAESIFNKLSKETQEKIIEVLPKFIESDAWRIIQYIPYPTTFLNGERWEDDLTAYKEPTKEPKFPRVEKIFKIEYVEPEHSEAYKKQLEIIRKYTAFFIFGDEVSALEILKSLHKYLPKDRYEEAMIKWNYEVYEYKDKSKFANMIPVFNEFLKANYAE